MFTIKQLCLWCNSITLQEFAIKVYNRKKYDFLKHNVDDYVTNKYKMFQSDPIAWMSNLDPQNMAKLGKLIKEYSDMIEQKIEENK